MSRPLRIEMADGLYHVTARGWERRVIVASEHDELQPERVEIFDGLGGGGFDRVGDGEESSRLAINGLWSRISSLAWSWAFSAC